VPRPNVPQTEYVNLHVTILTTTSPTLNATYFGQEPHPPTMILTTFEGARKGGKEPPFNSISYHGRIAEGKDEWVVKIFSKAKPTKKWLNKVFNNRVGWVYHKVVSSN
jgi:prenylcysteine oxidase/farnesylcysteine lyase